MRPLMDPAERKRRKRIYNRHKQQIYRQNALSEINSLQQLVPELEAQLTALLKLRPSTSCLPWREVATALAAGKSESDEIHEKLVAKKNSNQVLLEAMVAWVAAQQGLQAPARCPVQKWRHISLPVASDARKLGLDWISRQMLYNTERILSLYMLPQAAAICGAFHLEDLGDNCMQYTLVDQVVHAAPLENHSRYVRARLANWLQGNLFTKHDTLELLDPHLVQEVDPRMMYIQSHGISKESHYYVLFREWHVSGDRVVFVGQNIHTDEALPVQTLTCNRTFWVVLDRLPSGATIQRMVLQRSQHFTSTGFVPLEEEARLWGLDLSDCTNSFDQAARFERDLRDIQYGLHRITWGSAETNMGAG
ncbi:hypothetical protein ACHHYP_02021 [Achlya hypogyna]|uniref:Uncharacterized protein n=1 Tax=Achlya hypogyna TaxID=1202772 RepID=A0A1V9ZSH9_ACHHY|nr:hypothetical protein ACHHYP_02021 [Achlya hypogyna]